MTILALSDSHGSGDLVRRALQRAERGGKPDALVFAGDGLEDVLPWKGFCALFLPVRGNWDGDAVPGVPAERTETLGGVRFLIAHGNGYHVKSSTAWLAARAGETGAGVAVYGHTHRQEANWSGGILLVNPGALCRGEYAMLRIREGGLVEPELLRL